MIGQEEENKIINETKFAKWLSDRGDADSLGIPTKAIEEELRKVINLTKEKHDEKVHEDSHILYDLIWKETKTLREFGDNQKINDVVDEYAQDTNKCLSGIARRIETYSERTDWKFILEKKVEDNISKKIFKLLNHEIYEGEVKGKGKLKISFTDYDLIKKSFLGDES